MLKRGHDGPARLAEIRLEDTRFTTPFLFGLEEYPEIQQVKTYLRDQIKSEHPLLISLGSSFSNIDISSLQGHDYLLLFPSFPNANIMGSTFGSALLELQFEFLWENQEIIDPAKAVVRIPSSIKKDDLMQHIPKFRELDIAAASFSFDGLLGESDISSMELRSCMPANIMTLALGRIAPWLIPYLFYFGFDGIDTSLADSLAIAHIRLWPDCIEHIRPKEQPRYCACHHCENASSLSVENIRTHNYSIYVQQLSKSVHTFNRENLRWLVESSTHASPNLASFIRISDSINYDYIERFTPVMGLETRPLIGPESYHAPAIRRFRGRVSDRYIPPIGKKIVILLPCSARKPYSDSRSHRRIKQAIEGVTRGRDHAIAEVILTSPLGVVPRELERTFPASVYDIPVSGEWDNEELDIGAKSLVKHLSKFDNDATIVAHVSGGYQKIVRKAEDGIEQKIIYTTGIHSSTSRWSLNVLRDVLTSELEELSIPSGASTLLEDVLRATVDFQFGRSASKVLVANDATFGGKTYGMIVCRFQNEQLCSYLGDSGSISLTLPGGKRLVDYGSYLVHFEGTELQGSTLFAVGVDKADEQIRPGDEVIIINAKGVVVGVGKSEMSGMEMMEMKNGHAVRVRHKE